MHIPGAGFAGFAAIALVMVFLRPLRREPLLQRAIRRARVEEGAKRNSKRGY
jgi:hypothetical protein